jgi:3-dehydroquinate synthase
MIIHSKFKDYKVDIVDDFSFFDELVNTSFSQFVIDSNVYCLYKQLFNEIYPERLIVLDSYESVKTIDTVLQICEKMTNIPAKRNTHLISIGGGIIQDITGFVASSLYRGINWTFVPTTLLAGCDSCIGGKTSLNFLKYKNLLGSFYPPDHIVICPSFFKTLTQKDFESGLGEVVKFNIMAGPDGLDYIEGELNNLLSRDDSSLKKCIENSLQFKKTFIEIDEFDRGERIKLNFAHTFGHGIETVTDYAIPHGTAVAMGMIMANHISLNRKMISEEFYFKCESILRRIIHIDFDFNVIDFDEYVKAVRKDKKQINDQITAVLLSGDNRELKLVHDVQLSEISEAFSRIKDLF